MLAYDDAYLKKMCSDITLQSQKEGFFNQWTEQVESNVSADLFKKFETLKTDRERLKAMWKEECVHSLQIESFSTLKNQKISEEKRKQGNEAYHTKDNRKALRLYSQAVIRAPTEGTDLPLSLANRSAVLFHLEEFELCLEDIRLAIKAGYPIRLRHKVYDRRGQCLVQLGKTEEAMKSFEDADLALKESDLDEPKRKVYAQDLKKKMNEIKCEITQPTNSNTQMKKEEIYDEDLFRGSSRVLPKASAALGLNYTKETGRFMAACEDIPVGKALVRERPFCSVLMQEKRGAFCEHCFKSLIAPIPCTICSGVAFCSSSCRDEAWTTYHQWECPYLNLFKGSGMSLNCFLALRVITERGLTYFKKIYPHLSDPSLHLPTQEFPHKSEDYKSFYNLVGLEDQRTAHDFFKRTLMAIFLLKVLQHSKFFPKTHTKEATDISEDESIIGSLILRHLQVIQFNAHEVSGISFDGEKSFKKCKSVFIGLAVYPTVSFFNHSCFPAVGRYFNGAEMTIVSLRPVRKGDLIPENYGPIFTHTPRRERQRKLLSRYWFQCSCEACINDWSTYDTMPNVITVTSKDLQLSTTQNEHNTQSVKTNKKKRKKNKGSNRYDNKQDEGEDTKSSFMLNLDPVAAHKDFEVGKSLMDDFKREAAINAFGRWVSSSAFNVKLPLKDLHLALEALRLLVAARGSHYMNLKTENTGK